MQVVLARASGSYENSTAVETIQTTEAMPGNPERIIDGQTPRQGEELP